MAGRSPRGPFKHAVVGRVKVKGDSATVFECLHDPHPGGGDIIGDPEWAGFFTLLEPSVCIPSYKLGDNWVYEKAIDSPVFSESKNKHYLGASMLAANILLLTLAYLSSRQKR